MPVQINLVIERVIQFRYRQIIGDFEFLGVIWDNETLQQQGTQKKIEKAVEIKHDLNMTQVDTATTDPNPIEPETKTKVESETALNCKEYLKVEDSVRNYGNEVEDEPAQTVNVPV